MTQFIICSFVLFHFILKSSMLSCAFRHSVPAAFPVDFSPISSMSCCNIDNSRGGSPARQIKYATARKRRIRVAVHGNSIWKTCTAALVSLNLVLFFSSSSSFFFLPCPCFHGQFSPVEQKSHDMSHFRIHCPQCRQHLASSFLSLLIYFCSRGGGRIPHSSSRTCRGAIHIPLSAPFF